MSVICRVWCLVVALVLISEFHGAWGSYAGSASAIIDPTKVKQVSWKPRSLSLFLSFLLLFATEIPIFGVENVKFNDNGYFLMRCRAFVYQGFLTDLECDHLISIAKSELKRSAVADNLSGQSKLSEVRTSSGMFISKNKVLTFLFHYPGFFLIITIIIK